MNIYRVIPGEYRDSLFLMKMSTDISHWPGVKQAVIVMGTDSNRKILEQVGLSSLETNSATSNDLIIAIELTDQVSPDEISNKVNAILSRSDQVACAKDNLSDLTTALHEHPEIHLVAISTPGEIAVSQAEQALQAGKHVFCFSHHIPIESEIELKDLAIQKNLFMMGPDCGTSVIDGVGLGFANRVRQGAIGIISASGSGLQEVISLVHRSGAGISQAVGVGGRDLTSLVGGRMAEQALLRVSALPQTKVIIILAKKASKEAEQRLIKTIGNIDLPIVTQLQGLTRDTEQAVVPPIVIADTYEDCAKYAVLLSGGQWLLPDRSEHAAKWIEEISHSLKPEMQFLRGLYGGGSLCAETYRILNGCGFRIQSNLVQPIELTDNTHMFLDLGAEEYTEGRAHPFIDHRLRSLEIEKAFANLTVGILLVDMVLGYGSHPDPAGEFIEALKRAKEKHGTGPAIIASICGTLEDNQNYAQQRNKLEEQGVFVAESNAAAAFLARDLLIQRISISQTRKLRPSAEEALISQQMNIVNLGIPIFIEGPQTDGATVLSVDWKPELKISDEMKSLLNGLL